MDVIIQVGVVSVNPREQKRPPAIKAHQLLIGFSCQVNIQLPFGIPVASLTNMF